MLSAPTDISWILVGGNPSEFMSVSRIVGMGTVSSGEHRVDAATLETATAVFKKKWSSAVLRALLADGPQGFSDLEQALEDVSGKVLSDCLETLQEKDIIERRVLQEEPLRVEYALTERGRDLESAIEALESWAETHLVEERPTVLLVDDDSRLLEMHRSWLTETYEVQTATDGNAARQQLDSDVDVLVTDQRMPKLSGEELAKYVTLSEFDCGVVALSSVDIDDSVSETPFDEYLRKPSTPGELEDAIETVLPDGDELY